MLSVREAMRRPVRKAPQLLVLPERDRVQRALVSNCVGPVVVLALELERNESLDRGEVLELVTVVRDPENGKRVTLRHVMPGGEPNMREIIGGAEAHGQTISMRFRRYGGEWARAMVSDDF